MTTDQRLDEYTKDEWRVVLRRIDPKLTDEDFEKAWAEFMAMKAQKELH